MDILIWIGGLTVLATALVIQYLRQRRTIAEGIAKETSERFNALFNQTAFGVIILDRNGKLTHANEVFASLVNQPLVNLINKPLVDIMYPEDVADFESQLELLESDSIPNMACEKRLIRPNGEQVWALISCAMSSDGIIGQVTDITDRKEDEDTIYKLAYYDTLTGLPNRLHFNQYSKQTLDRARNGNWRFSIFLIDLDNFKAVNDTYGHHIGDTLLKEVAIKLDGVVSLRCELEQDCRCFCARLGGDEFILIIENIRDIKDATQIADWVFTSLKNPIAVGPHELKVSVSIGISMYPYDGASISSLLRSADLALYSAKDKGKNTFAFHEAGMNQRFEQEFEYQNVLRYLTETKDFDLLYQPTLDMNSGKVTGAEVLLGGNKQKYPRLNIETLIILAEETGAIIELGEMILEKACRDYVREIQPHVNSSFGLSVNVSVRQLEDPGFVSIVTRVLESTNMPPDHLILEITETSMTVYFTEITTKLQQLSELGIRIAIDDFGKGYSSMSHLQNLSTHKLKIDKSLIDNINSNVKGKEIVRAIVLMSHTLGLTCTAEGVETDVVFKVLRELDCDEVQGYLISPSLLLPDFKKYLVLSNH